MSPKTVLGGGTIGAAMSASDAPAEPVASDVVAIRTALAGAGIAASTAEALGARANVRVERVLEILADDMADDRVWQLARPAAYIDGGVADELVARIVASLTARHAREPWALGATSLALAREHEVAEALLVRILAAAVERERLSAKAGYYAVNGFTPALTPEQTAFIERFVVADPAQPLVPAPFDPLVQELRRSKIPGIAIAFDTLVAQGALVRVGEHVYREAQMREIRARLIQTLRAEGRVTAARLRDVVGTSRKYIVPLLEYFDSSGLTVRDGDVRALRARTIEASVM
jgi:hypothetical protein